MSFFKIVIIFGIVLWNCAGLTAQVLPHQEFRVRYYLKQSEYLKSSILAPKSVRTEKFLADFFVISNPSNHSHASYESNYMDSQFILTTSFPVFSQYKGFDTIMDITETVQTRPFYIGRKEVSNKEYRQFLSDSASAIFKSLNIPFWALLPDTTVWISPKMYNEAYKDYYFRHPAFDDYPVVGVSAIQAKAYCQWLGLKFQSSLPIGIMDNYRIEGDLPTSAEW